MQRSVVVSSLSIGRFVDVFACDPAVGRPLPSAKRSASRLLRFSFCPPPTRSEGGFFKAELKFPEDFPNRPPQMTFKSEMWHPNVYPDGKVCISILHEPGVDKYNTQESADERWRPILGVEQVLISVLSMLSEPNADSPANIDAAKQFRDSPSDFKKRVRRCVEKSLDC